MEQSDKSKDLTDFLEALAGRSTAIHNNRCINPPFGCGKAIVSFRDSLSEHEYTISGLCQECQNEVFKGQTGD